MLFYERLLSSSNNSGSALGRYCRCCVPLIRGDGSWRRNSSGLASKTKSIQATITTPYPCFTEALVDIKALIAGQIIELCRVQKILYLHFGVDLLFLQFRSCLLNVLNESTKCSDGFQIVTRFNQVQISSGRRKHFRMLRGDGPHFNSRIFRGYIVSEKFHRLSQAEKE